MPITKLRPSFTFTEDRLAELRAVVPEAFADGKINWEVLQEALGEYLEEPDAEQTLEILKGIKERYEEHHRLVISEEALSQAATLAARYIPDRFLPDKAIDDIDEAASRVSSWPNTVRHVLSGRGSVCLVPAGAVTR